MAAEEMEVVEVSENKMAMDVEESNANREQQELIATQINEYASNLSVPNIASKVYNEQSVASMVDRYHEAGLFVNMRNYQSFGVEYVEWDANRSGNNLYLNMKFQKEEIQSEDIEEPTVLGIGVEGGFSFEGNFRTVKTFTLVLFPEQLTLSYPNDLLSDHVNAVVESIINHSAPSIVEDLTAWQEEILPSPAAENLAQLDNGKKISPNPKDWKCEMSGATDNLWLNLSTGYIGGGRKYADGSGGSGGAQVHYEQQLEQGNMYPLVVKLGTINSQGADLFDYAHDCTCTDPRLAEHLAHWGIDIMSQVKTEKSTQEMQLEMNKQFDYSSVVGEHVEAVTGSGLIGLDNLGNSCYMNSVLQTLVSLPEVGEKYLNAYDDLLETAPRSTLAEDYPLQMAKLCKALLTEQFVVDDTQNAVAPMMIRALIAKGHAEFSSKRQQDAEEYLGHTLSYITQQENRHTNRLGNQSKVEDQFKFTFEERLECNVSGHVRYTEVDGQILPFVIDMNEATNLSYIEETQAAKRQKVEENTETNPKTEEKIIPVVPFESCLDGFLAPENLDEWKSPATNEQSGAHKTRKVKTFPKYLMVQLRRYYVDETWTPKKLEVRVDLPEELDLSSLQGEGLQPNETELSDAIQNTFVADEMIILAVTMMGFTRNAGIRAAKAVSNSNPEAAVNWLMGHMGDANINDPIEEENNANESTVDEMALVQLVSFGIPEDVGRFCLEKQSNNVERAISYYYDNMSTIPTMMEQEAVNKAMAASGNNAPEVNGPPEYQLHAIISHLGSRTDGGHYVCHIKKNGLWYLFNDNKVTLVEEPPYGFGYLYLYQRRDTLEAVEEC